MRRAVVAAVLAAALTACAGNREPESAVPTCLVDCPAPPAAEIVGELTVPAIASSTALPAVGGRVIVTGAELDEIVRRQRATLWVRVGADGKATEIRVAQSSGSMQADRDLIESVADRRLPVERAGWYRTRVRQPRPR